MKVRPVAEKAGFSKMWRLRRPKLAVPAVAACCMASLCLIPTAGTAATFDGGFEVSVIHRGVEARVLEVGLGSDMELFYFDNPEDPEVLVKVLDGCAVNGHRWVLIAAATDRSLGVTVRHSATGSVRQYSFVPGHPSQSVSDIAAFSEGCTSTSVATAARSGTGAVSSKGGEPEYVAGSATLRNRFLT